MTAAGFIAWLPALMALAALLLILWAVSPPRHREWDGIRERHEADRALGGGR